MSQIFVKIEKIEVVKKTMASIRKQLEEANSILGKIKELKEQEDKEVAEWEQEVRNMQQTLEQLDSSLNAQ
ncbi:hypothetical protein J4475_02250 [Candidatus Woesearchaeota archaeon]|nr:hypothetical protein [Candidatus Woesearchaeota archaeon]